MVTTRSQRTTDRSPREARSKPSAIRDRLGRRGYCFRGGRVANRVEKGWHGQLRARKSRGMVREGMLCYRLAALQCLLHVPRFVNFLNKDHEDCRHEASEQHQGCSVENRVAACSLCRLINLSCAYWGEGSNDDASERLKELNYTLNDHFFSVSSDMGDTSEQQDSHEFLMALISSVINNQHAAPQQDAVETILDRLTKAKLKDTQTAQACGHAHTTEPYTAFGMTLSTFGDGVRDGTTLEHLIDSQWISTSYDVCRIEDCKQHREGTKTKISQRTKVVKAPEILVIQLNRIEQSDKRRARLMKSTNYIDYPEELKLRGYGAGATYRLDAVTCHVGDSARAGHYVAVVREPDQSISTIDDRTVKTFENPADDEDPVHRKQAQKAMRQLLDPSKGDAAVLYYSKI